ncbi:MAG: hypothetical protein HQM16_07080 [Deltaproteobacteria bacterium]|nr:hypothetical protein [Deltaproteobacteria bacterium]
MVPFKQNLEALAKCYVTYLIDRDASVLKNHLSLDFMIRQKVSEQIRLITCLPRLFYGIDIEIVLKENYHTVVVDDCLYISPFQFGVIYSPHTNLIEIENITITMNGVILQDNEWKIESIIRNDEKSVLINVINNLQKRTLTEG